MKRLYFALILIILSVIICTFSSIKVEDYSESLKAQLKDIGTVINQKDNSRALYMLEKAEEGWNKTEGFFSFIIDADKIEELSISFSMIKAHIKDGNTEHALERLRECELMLGEISENEQLDIKNVM